VHACVVSALWQMNKAGVGLNPGINPGRLVPEESKQPPQQPPPQQQVLHKMFIDTITPLLLLKLHAVAFSS